MGYASLNRTTGASPSRRDTVSKTTDVKTLKLLAVGTQQGVLSQKTSTTTTTWTGLSQSDALSLCTSSESSTLTKEGTTTVRPFLGGAKFVVGSDAVKAWVTIEECWGTRTTTSISRINDTNLYQVTRQTIVMDVYASGGTLTLL